MFIAAELLVDFYTDRKTILMNYSCFSFHVGNKPRLKPGRNTDGIFEGASLIYGITAIYTMAVVRAVV